MGSFGRCLLWTSLLLLGIGIGASAVAGGWMGTSTEGPTPEAPTPEPVTPEASPAPKPTQRLHKTTSPTGFRILDEARSKEFEADPGRTLRNVILRVSPRFPAIHPQLALRPGDVVRVRNVSGRWTAHAKSLPWVDEQGHPKLPPMGADRDLRMAPDLPLGRLLGILNGEVMDLGAGQTFGIERGGSLLLAFNGRPEALPESQGNLTFTVQVSSRAASPASPSVDRSQVLEEREEEGLRIVRRSATRTRYWQSLPLDNQDHPEIVKYRIRWFNGKWSPWYFPGDGDIDWKVATRRVWCYFDDHEHEYAIQKP